MKVYVYLEIECLNFADINASLDHLQMILDDFKGEDKIIKNYDVNFTTISYDSWSKK